VAIIAEATITEAAQNREPLAPPRASRLVICGHFITEAALTGQHPFRNGYVETGRFWAPENSAPIHSSTDANGFPIVEVEAQVGQIPTGCPVHGLRRCCWKLDRRPGAASNGHTVGWRGTAIGAESQLRRKSGSQARILLVKEEDYTNPL
jgi:hypothetical protein